MGPSSPNKQLAIDNIDIVCKTIQGNFRAGLERTSCVTNTATGNEWFFSVKCIAKSDKTLPFNQCQFGLRREIDGCSTGGDRKDGDWEYRSDANEGVCIDVNHINNPPKDRKRDITSVFGEPEVLDKTEKREVKITFGNAVPPQPKEKREVKVTYGNAVPPQPAEKRGSRFAV